MLDSIVGSPVLLSLLCAALAALIVSPGYTSLSMNGLAIPAPLAAKFPLKSFARAALIAFIVLINLASLGLAHRLPLGSTLIATGFLMLAFLPADDPRSDA